MKKHGTPDQPRDVELFHQSMTGVTRLREAGRVTYHPRRPKPLPSQRLADERQVLADSLSDHIPYELALESGEELAYLRRGLSRQTLKQLRRGHWVIQDQIDLHGMTAAEARVMLVEFLNRCLKEGRRCVRVIHGKGLRSKNREPVLKHKVANWLMQRDEVLAFCQARAADGGGGAAVVLLKNGKR